MEKIFEKFLGIIETLPLVYKMITLILLLVAFIAYKIFSSEKIQRLVILKIYKKIGKYAREDLLIHPFFTRKQRFLNTISLMKFESENKTEIFKMLFRIKLNIDNKLSISYVENIDFNGISKHILVASMMSLVSEFIESYEKDFLESLQKKYNNEKGLELFNFIMNHPTGFRQKRVDRINRIVYQIDVYIRNSQIFDNNIERVVHFFNELLYALRISIFQAEKDFKDMNGHIDEIINKDD